MVINEAMEHPTVWSSLSIIFIGLDVFITWFQFITVYPAYAVQACVYLKVLRKKHILEHSSCLYSYYIHWFHSTESLQSIFAIFSTDFSQWSMQRFCRQAFNDVKGVGFDCCRRWRPFQIIWVTITDEMWLQLFQFVAAAGCVVIDFPSL